MLECFADRLHARIRARDSRLCVGLDPDLARIPHELLRRFKLDPAQAQAPADLDQEALADCIEAFCLEVVDLVEDLACAVKPQAAHFEAYGPQGLRALQTVCRKARERGLLVVLDGKRNDIGSTAQRYAAAYLGPDSGPNRAPFSCDALTVTPFLGVDGIKPFVEQCALHGKGIFVLVKTSNPSGAQVQDLRIAPGEESLAERLAGLVTEWGSELVGQSGYSSVGAVIGATHPDKIKRLRELMPQAPILLPGFGAQGATAGDAADAFDANGDGAIVNSSRGVLYPCAPDAENYFGQVRAKAQAARDAIQRMIER